MTAAAAVCDTEAGASPLAAPEPGARSMGRPSTQRQCRTAVKRRLSFTKQASPKPGRERVTRGLQAARAIRRACSERWGGHRRQTAMAVACPAAASSVRQEPSSLGPHSQPALMRPRRPGKRQDPRALLLSGCQTIFGAPNVRCAAGCLPGTGKNRRRQQGATGHAVGCLGVFMLRCGASSCAGVSSMRKHARRQASNPSVDAMDHV